MKGPVKSEISLALSDNVIPKENLTESDVTSSGSLYVPSSSERDSGSDSDSPYPPKNNGKAYTIDWFVGPGSMETVLEADACQVCNRMKARCPFLGQTFN